MVSTRDEAGSINWPDLPDLFEKVGSVVQAPIAASLATAIDQPWVKSALREGLAFTERCQEVVAESREYLDDRWAEIEYEVSVARSRQPESSNRAASRERSASFPASWQEPSHLSSDLMMTVGKLNEFARRMTDGEIDLYLLVPLGLSAFALRQLLVKGWELEEIPWYVLAWYAFDSFMKFHAHDRHFSTYPGLADGTRPDADFNGSNHLN